DLVVSLALCGRSRCWVISSRTVMGATLTNLTSSFSATQVRSFHHRSQRISSITLAGRSLSCHPGAHFTLNPRAVSVIRRLSTDVSRSAPFSFIHNWFCLHLEHV